MSEWALNAMANVLVMEGGRSFNTDGRGAGTVIEEAEAAGTQTRTENLDKVRTGVCPRSSREVRTLGEEICYLKLPSLC